MSITLLKCLLLAAVVLLFTSCGGGGPKQPAPQLPADDNDAPAIVFGSISDGQTLSGGLLVRVSATDPNGVFGMRLVIDGEEVSTTSESEINWYWNTSLFPNGICTVLVSASDTLGNGAVNSVIVQLSNAGPVPDPGPIVGPDPPDPDPVGPDPPAPPVAPPPLVVNPAPRPVAEEIFPILLGGQPDFFDPVDETLPRPIIFGLKQDEVVTDGRDISIICTDDRGVAAVCVRIGDNQQWYAEGARLDLKWDTTRQPDGVCFFNIYILDVGLHVTDTAIKVTVLNGPDHEGPAIKTNIPLDTYSYGPIHLIVTATDPSGVESITIREEYSQPSDFIAQVLNEETLKFDWTPLPGSEFYPSGGRNLVIEAVDKRGYTSKLEGGLGFQYNFNWHAQFQPQRSYEGIHGPFSLEMTRIVNRGPEGANGPVSFTYSRPESSETAHASLSGLDLTPSKGPPIERIPCGLYHMKFSVDDYVYEWDEALVSASAEKLYAQPLDWKTGYRQAEQLPGLRWNNVPQVFGLVAAPGSDVEILNILGNKKFGPTVQQFPSLRLALRSEIVMAQAKWLQIGHGIPDAAEALDDPLALDNLRTWVRDGGQLLVSGDSYDFIEQLWPERIAFSGAGSEDGLSQTSQPRDGAELAQWPPDCTFDLDFYGGQDFPESGVRINASAQPLPAILAVGARVSTVMTASAGPDGLPTVSMVAFPQGLGHVVYSAIPFNSPPAAEAWQHQMSFTDYAAESLQAVTWSLW